MTYKKIINRSITWAEKDQNILGLWEYSTYLVKRLLKLGIPSYFQHSKNIF